MKLWLSSLLFVILLAAAVPSGVLGADASAGETAHVDVWVTGSGDRPVTDLAKDDFDLLIGGQKAEITDFYAVRDGVRLDSGHVDDPVFLVVFIDNLDLGASNRERTLGELRGFLEERLREDDRVLLVSFDGRVRVHQEVTRGGESLDRALEAIAGEPSYGHLRGTQESRVVNDIMNLSDKRSATGPRVLCPRLVKQMAESHAREVYDQIHTSVAGLFDLIPTLASLPGRKAVLHVSDGIPFQPAAGLYELLRNYCGGEGENLDPDTSGDLVGITPSLGVIDPVKNTSYFGSRGAELETASVNASTLFAELTDQANAHRVTLNAVEAAGARTLSASSTHRRQRRALSRRADEVRWANLQQSLTVMAENTGGRAVLNTKRLSQDLGGLGRDLDNYYAVEYRVPDTVDSRALRVKVAVSRDDLRIRHRRSARGRPITEGLAGRTQATLLHDVTDNPLGIEVEVGPATPVDEMQMVPIRLRIPLGKVALEGGDDGYHGQLRVFVSDRDRNGYLSPVRASEVPIAVPSDQLAAARSKDYLYEVKMLWAPGGRKLAIGVHDEIASVGSFMTEDVLVFPR